MPLSFELVHLVRVNGCTDAHNARVMRTTVDTVRKARIGLSHRDHPTPPDKRPRMGTGRYQGPKAVPAKQRRF